jgi:hypothetical protein
MKKIATPFIASSSPIAKSNKAISDGYKAADAAIEAAYKAADTTIASAVIANKSAADAAIAAVTARVTTLESPSTVNTSYLLSGSPYTAAVAIGLRGLVHVRADGKIEPADDTVQGKEANGIIDAPIAANASGNVYGTGTRFSAVGLGGTQPGSQLFTGTAGLISLSSSGNGRFIQQIGIYKNSLYYFDFTDVGYWLELL